MKSPLNFVFECPEAAHKQNNFFPVVRLGYSGSGQVRNMAANCGRRTLQLTGASAKTLFSRSSLTSPLSSTATKLSGLTSPIKPSSATRLSSLHKLTLSRLPVELGGALSLMPSHSVTASALFTSLLSLNNENWGCLSEGFATPL